MKRNTSLFYEAHATYFLTTTVTKFSNIFAERELALILLSNLNFYLKDFKASLHGFVIMPNHLHLLVTMGDKGNVSQFMGRLKEFSAKQIIGWCQDNKASLLKIFADSAEKHKPQHEYQVWQARFDDLRVEGNNMFDTRLDYIHANPVQEQWKLADNPEDYEFSSARFYEKGEDVGIPISILE